ncbi:hypothetical protein HELRODRAFT_188354 [Helobdella robusta]|uniref:SMP-30/Gluconolactonase/LRE-like region domain-containing protein n=1 Tax=Helobdella robusta TaxID=6412 RepID=T1FPW9_HELRO|nr:hypothetical protein HELRODRAFT_188354 [Helobdella robusta]ESO06414.1 hypothetical protein HELRODRAFT_188354 [Helobdella robusta]
MFQFLTGKSILKSSKTSKSSVVSRSRSTARRKHLASGLLRCTGGERSRSCTPERNARISCRLPSEYTQLSPEEFLKSFSTSTERLSANGVNGKGKSSTGGKSSKKKLSKSEKQKIAMEREQQKKKLMLLQHQEQMLLQLQQQNKQDHSSSSNCSSLKENNRNKDNKVWESQHMNSYDVLPQKNPLQQTPTNQVINSDNYIIRLNPSNQISNNNTPIKSNNDFNTPTNSNFKSEHGSFISRNNTSDVSETIHQNCSSPSQAYPNKSVTFQEPDECGKPALRPKTLSATKRTTFGVIPENDAYIKHCTSTRSCENNLNLFENVNSSVAQYNSPYYIPHYDIDNNIINNNNYNSNGNYNNENNSVNNLYLPLNHKQRVLQFRSQPTTPDEPSLDYLNNLFASSACNQTNNFNATPQRFMSNYPHDYIIDLAKQLSLQEPATSHNLSNNYNLNVENCNSVDNFYGCAENYHPNNQNYLINGNSYLNYNPTNNTVNNVRAVRTRLFGRFDDHHHRRSPGMGCRSAMMRKLAQCHCQPVLYNPSSSSYQFDSSSLGRQQSDKCEMFVNGNKLSHEVINHCSPILASTRTSSVERKLHNDSGVCSVSDDERFSTFRNNVHLSDCHHSNNNCNNHVKNVSSGKQYGNIYSFTQNNYIPHHTSNRPNSQLFDTSSIETDNYLVACFKKENIETRNGNEYVQKLSYNNCNIDYALNKQNNYTLQQQFQQQLQQRKQRQHIETVKRSRSTPCDTITSSSSSSSSKLPLTKTLQLSHVIQSRITDMVVTSRNSFIVAVDMHNAFLFDSEGEFHGKLGGRHHRKHSLIQPLSVANCGDSCVAFNDRGQQNIKVFSLDDQLMFIVDDQLFTNIAGLSCNVDGDIFIAATDTKCVFVFQLQSPDHLRRLPPITTSDVNELASPKVPQRSNKNFDNQACNGDQCLVETSNEKIGQDDDISLKITNEKFFNHEFSNVNPKVLYNNKSMINKSKNAKPLFDHPYCIAVNPTNQEVIVGDDERHLVVAMDAQTGRLIWRFLPHEARDGNFLPACICCDWRGNVFVADSCNNKIYMLNSSGKFLKTLLSMNNGLRGSPSAICTDSTGRLYVTDEQSFVRVFKYLDDGSL